MSDYIKYNVRLFEVYIFMYDIIIIITTFIQISFFNTQPKDIKVHARLLNNYIKT